VDFSNLPLNGKNYGQTHSCPKGDNLSFIHGTAMAGLIAADHSINLQKNDTLNEFLNIAGIAPKTLIKNSEINQKNLEVIKNTYKEAQEERTPISKGNLPYLKKVIRPNLILINFSGATTIKDTSNLYSIEKTDWTDFAKRICEDKYTLLVTSVGNSGSELNKHYEYLPAALSMKSCKKLDPIIRTGAVKKFGYGDTPEIYHNSNYGRTVDILAPGGEIPILISNNKALIGSGTSESAAIISATAALLNACHTKATAQEIKHAILNYADSHNTLKDKAFNGRVLNIENTVRNFCINHKFSDKNQTIEYLVLPTGN
jgi:hypothetical protein